MSVKKTSIWCAIGLILLAGIWGLAFVRNHGFSAREKPTALEASVARRLRWLATPPGVRTLSNPLSETELAVAEGRDHFADHCAVCHANNGSGTTTIGKGLYPPPPDLTHLETQSLTDGELYFIIMNGIRFTGMPGFGGEDDENWKLVMFIRHLPDLSTSELNLMREINGLQSAGEPGGHQPVQTNTDTTRR